MDSFTWNERGQQLLASHELFSETLDEQSTDSDEKWGLIMTRRSDTLTYFESTAEAVIKTALKDHTMMDVGNATLFHVVGYVADLLEQETDNG